VETAEATSQAPDFLERTVAYLPFVIEEGEDNLDFLLSGFSSPQFGYRWSMCDSVMVAFKLDKLAAADRAYMLSLTEQCQKDDPFSSKAGFGVICGEK
jgi:hypothetical protein